MRMSTTARASAMYVIAVFVIVRFVIVFFVIVFFVIVLRLLLWISFTSERASMLRGIFVIQNVL